jgi:hypothetical protein
VSRIATAPAVVGPRPWRWTRQQYLALGEQGFFRGQRVELIHGKIVVMSPWNEPHVTSVSLVTEVLRGAFGPGHFVRVQAPLSFGLDSVPEPDVAVVPRTFNSPADTAGSAGRLRRTDADHAPAAR